MTKSTAPLGGGFVVRDLVLRSTSVLAAAGLTVAISLLGAGPAHAATDADCNAGNTVDSTAAVPGTVADIEVLLGLDTPIICLSGTFKLATPLNYDYNVTFHGLVNGALDGDNTTGILVDLGSNTLLVENLGFVRGAARDGAAIDGYYVRVRDSLFFQNVASGAGDNFGGAISAIASEVSDSRFYDNVGGVGGAIFTEQYLSIAGSTFDGNTAEYGGAVAAQGAVGAFESTFEWNTATFGGAILGLDETYSYASTFRGNTAQIGGAIYVSDFSSSGNAVLDVQNSTFAGNYVEDFGEVGASINGSALHAYSGTVRQSTFLDNEDSAAVGPSHATIVAFEDSLEIRGNIFASSSVIAHLASENGGTIADAGANLFTTAQASETVLSSVQPTTLFDLTTLAIFNGATLADNGGPTRTVALHGASPALSAVPASPDSMTADQRSVSRPAISDAGAFELDDPIIVAGSGDAELAATGSEHAPWLFGFAALLVAAGLTTLGLARRETRRISRGFT